MMAASSFIEGLLVADFTTSTDRQKSKKGMERSCCRVLSALYNASRAAKRTANRDALCAGSLRQYAISALEKIFMSALSDNFNQSAQRAQSTRSNPTKMLMLCVLENDQ